jgi:hypothetical protein
VFKKPSDKVAPKNLIWPFSKEEDDWDNDMKKINFKKLEQLRLLPDATEKNSATFESASSYYVNHPTVTGNDFWIAQTPCQLMKIFGVTNGSGWPSYGSEMMHNGSNNESYATTENYVTVDTNLNNSLNGYSYFSREIPLPWQVFTCFDNGSYTTNKTLLASKSELNFTDGYDTFIHNLHI